MRVLWVPCVLLLTGCAGAWDAATKVTTANTTLRNAFTANIELERALLADTASKSGQLAFISMGDYICGDPTDPYNQMATRYLRNPAERRVAAEKWRLKTENIEASLRDHYKTLDVIMDYADALAKTMKGFEAAETTLNKLDASVTAFQKYASGEAGVLLGAFREVVKLLQAARGAAARGKIIDAARKAQADLDVAYESFAKSNALREMTADESVAFTYWDACARERLFFIRDFDPKRMPQPERNPKDPPLKPYLQVRLAGEGRTPLLDFAKEWDAYIAEREAFLARRPDFLGLLKEIIKTNRAIGTLKKDAEFDTLLDDLNYMEGVVSELSKRTEAIRAGLKT